MSPELPAPIAEKNEDSFMNLRNSLAGTIEHNLDPKRRIMIPARWREKMGNPKHLFVLPDPKEKCLSIVQYAEMALIQEKLRKINSFHPGYAKLMRNFWSNCENVELDSAGRMRISEKFLMYAGITNVVMLMGCDRRIQLWAPGACSSVVGGRDLDEVNPDELADTHQAIFELLEGGQSL